MKTNQNRILIIGANGQVGSVLTPTLKEKYGADAVIPTDIYHNEFNDPNFEILDATDYSAIESIVLKNNINQIYHLAAILSATGEANPSKAWDVNMNTLINVFEIARKHNVEKIFYPSSIAVFGASAALNNTPQDTYLDPSTMYGVTKVAGENLALYYYEKYGLDIRSVRYPGIIGYQSLPGGGTTDYAVDIYHKAIGEEDFECFLNADEYLPMIYMGDAIKATIDIMEAPAESISIRTSYNLSSMSFSPAEIYESIKVYYPNFNISYKPDLRQTIAEGWPNSIDDSKAREDWNWSPNFDLKAMTDIMLLKLKEVYATRKIVC